MKKKWKKKKKNLSNHSECQALTQTYNLAEGPLSVTCLLWSLWKSAQIRPSWKPRKITMHMLSGGLIEAGSKALQSFCLHYTCFILHDSSEMPAMSMPYPQACRSCENFSCNCHVCLPNPTAALGARLKNTDHFFWDFSGYTQHTDRGITLTWIQRSRKQMARQGCVSTGTEGEKMIRQERVHR